MQNIALEETIGALQSIASGRIICQIAEKESVSEKYVKWQEYRLSGRKRCIFSKI